MIKAIGKGLWNGAKFIVRTITIATIVYLVYFALDCCLVMHLLG